MAAHTATIVLVVCFILPLSSGVFINTGLLEDDYYSDGDLIIGSLFSLYEIIPNQQCGTRVNGKDSQMAHAVKYMIGKINKNPTLLPNISLGFVILNDCKRQTVAVTKATKFIPVRKCVRHACQEDSSTPKTGVGSKLFYDVVAVVGMFNSALVVTFSSLLSQFHIPQVGIGTSDELSDKVRYEYYSRILPADMAQARAIVGILQYYKWTYISTLHSEGSYGATGMKNIHKFARDLGICIAFSKELPPDFTNSDYDNVILNLQKHSKARALVLFLLHYNMNSFFRAVRRAGASRQFIFITSEGFSPEELSLAGEDAIGTISIAEPFGREYEFEREYLSINPWHNITGNPWFGQFHPDDVGCQFGIGAKKPCESYKRFTDFPSFVFTESYSNVLDQVQAVGFGLHSLISKECPEAFLQTDRELVRTCVRGDLLLQHIRNTSFVGVTGPIEFDYKGDPIASFRIRQARRVGHTLQLTTIGKWERETNRLTIDDTIVQFNGSDARDTDNSSVIPESVCAKPCRAGEFYIQGELVCCWECRRCRDNERVLGNRKSCEVCPENTWPDQLNFTDCLPIEPTYINWFDSFGMGLVGLASACVLGMLTSSVLLIKHRARKVVKGSNRELMAIITLGVLMAYATVFFYIKTPVRWSCYCTYIGFHLSCTLIFCPLFVKTLRLYRIFSAAEKCRQTASLLTVRAQLVVTFLMVAGQVRSGIKCFTGGRSLLRVHEKAGP